MIDLHIHIGQLFDWELWEGEMPKRWLYSIDLIEPNVCVSSTDQQTVIQTDSQSIITGHCLMQCEIWLTCCCCFWFCCTGCVWFSWKAMREYCVSYGTNELHIRVWVVRMRWLDFHTSVIGLHCPEYERTIRHAMNQTHHQVKQQKQSNNRSNKFTNP